MALANNERGSMDGGGAHSKPRKTEDTPRQMSMKSTLMTSVTSGLGFLNDQMKHKKKWSEKKMLEYENFKVPSSRIKFLGMLLYVPVTSLALAILPYLIPLAPWPKACSFEENCPDDARPVFSHYWAWNFLGFPIAVAVCWNQFTSWVFAFLGSTHHLSLKSMGIALICAATVSTTVYSLSALSVYPVPIASLTAFLPGAATTVIVLLLQIPKDAKENPDVQARIKLFMDTSNLCPATIVIFSAYTYIFRHGFRKYGVNSWQQFMFTLLLPPIREFLKFMFARSALSAAARSSEELGDITPSLVFGLRCFVNAFTVTLFQDAGFTAVLVIVLAEPVHLAFLVRRTRKVIYKLDKKTRKGVMQDLRRINAYQVKGDGDGGGQEHGQEHDPEHQLRPSVLQPVPESTSMALVIAPKQTYSDPEDQLPKADSVSTTANKSGARPGKISKAASALKNPMHHPQGHPGQKSGPELTNDRKAAYRDPTRVLFSKAESIVYSEFIGAFIPTQYLIFINFAYWGYNKDHFLEFDTMGQENFLWACVFIMIDICISLIASSIIYVGMKRAFHIDSVKLLLFLLNKYANLLIGTNASILVFVFGYLMKLLGDDFGFKFTWKD